VRVLVLSPDISRLSLTSHAGRPIAVSRDRPTPSHAAGRRRSRDHVLCFRLNDPQITQITQIKREFVEDFEAHSSPAVN
jgi:hypothetical protein